MEKKVGAGLVYKKRKNIFSTIFFYDSGLELRKCHSSLNTAVNTKTTMYSERPKMDLEELPPFRQRPPQFASKQSREGGNHHAGRVTRAFRRKIPEKAVKNTDFHSTPGSDLRREADCRVLPFLN